MLFTFHITFGVATLEFEVINCLITPTSFVVVVETIVPPKTPVPDTVCTDEPFRTNWLAIPKNVFILPLLVIFPATFNVLPIVPLYTFNRPPKSTVKFPLTEKDVGVAPYSRVPPFWINKLFAFCAAASIVTICEFAIVTLSPTVGTALASQVVGAPQFPVAIEIKFPGKFETNDTSSIAAGGFAIVEISLFQLKINRYEVPGVALKVIDSLFHAALFNLYIPLIAPGPTNCVWPTTAAVVGV